MENIVSRLLIPKLTKNKILAPSQWVPKNNLYKNFESKSKRRSLCGGNLKRYHAGRGQSYEFYLNEINRK